MRNAPTGAGVKHEPYIFRDVHVEKWSSAPLQQDGLITEESAPIHQCFVDGFHVEVYGTEKVL